MTIGPPIGNLNLTVARLTLDIACSVAITLAGWLGFRRVLRALPFRGSESPSGRRTGNSAAAGASVLRLAWLGVISCIVLLVPVAVPSSSRPP